jgi:transposase InsO family protein
VNVYPFIEAEKAEQDGTVAMACRLLEVSRAAYYCWSEHRPTRRELSDAELCELIGAIHRDSRGTYGAPRVTAELRQGGHHVSKKRVARLMARLGLAGRCKRRWKKTTVRDPDSEAAAVDLVRRVFGPGVHELDRVWCGDISYVRTWEGWCYLATVIDLASRRVVGFAVADHMRAELVCEAMEQALVHRRPPAGLVFHSDRGSQYTSGPFRALLQRHGVLQSLSRVGQCWDNAVAESLFGTLKEELVHRTVLPTRRHARLAIFEWIEVFYNRKRLHSALGYLSPADYERQRSVKHQQTQAA